MVLEIAKDQNSITINDKEILIFVPEKHGNCEKCVISEDRRFNSCAGIPCSTSDRIDRKTGYYKKK